MKRTLREAMKRGLRLLFEGGQRLGVDILPRHYYSEIPDLRELRRTRHWRQPLSMVGVMGTDIERQLAFVRTHCSPAVLEVLRARDVHAEACAANGGPGYGRVEADFLYAFVRTARPRQIFQIGCGVSTALCLRAAADAGYTLELTCVEPYPNDFLRDQAARGALTLVERQAQLLEPERIRALGADLLFFVDATHTLGPAGEVSRIVLDMLPLLSAGAHVHFHDITFPYDYDRHTLDRALVFPHESVLLHAFLAGNARFELCAALSMLHYAAPERLRALLPNYRPAGNDHGLATGPGHFPSAAYLRVTDGP
ncbi:MAG: class I SAM-dependent methyltransferase [Gemmatimonadota bacterium]